MSNGGGLIPELPRAHDDSSLKQQGGKDLNDLGDLERAEERVKVDLDFERRRSAVKNHKLVRKKKGGTIQPMLGVEEILLQALQHGRFCCGVRELIAKEENR